MTRSIWIGRNVKYGEIITFEGKQYKSLSDTRQMTMVKSAYFRGHYIRIIEVK